MAMSRPRIGATNTSRPRQTIRPSYEDFLPQFDMKEEAEAHIIGVLLPGFLKEQVRITFVHAPGVIRVHGQRPLGNNRWSRFNQTFPLPKNCHESKIHGKFNNGVLTITLPKEVASKTDPKKEEAPTQPFQEAKPQKGQDVIHETTIATAAKDPKTSASELEAHKGLPLKEDITKTKDHNDKEAGAAPYVISAITQNEKQREEKRVISLSSSASQTKPQKDKDETPAKNVADGKAKEDYQMAVQDRYIAEANEKPGEPKIAEDVVDLPLSRESEMTGRRIKVAAVMERIAPYTANDQVKKKSKRFGSGVDHGKTEEDCYAAKQGKKNLDKWINNEEKQLLINVGAAVLVLVAFGAYNSYNLWFGKPKN